MKSASITLLALIAALGCGVHAADLRPSAAFIAEGGVSIHGDYSVAAGVSWPWTWTRTSHSGEWTATTEAYVSHWNSRVPGERLSFTQVGVIPVFRYRFDHGRSDWFADAGIGISYMDRLYRRQTKQFSTRFNFVDVVGLGFNFGDQRKHEVGLRVAHISNAGLKRPNPGENFLQLRYGRSF